MVDPFKGPRLKLARAYDHLVDLERTERQFFEQNPTRIDFDLSSEPGHKLARIILDAAPPEIMHVIAGELIYQLRSSLDQLAVAMARMSIAKPNPKKVKYPCGDRLSDFKAKCKRDLAGFDRDFVKEIIRTRPYDGANDTLRAVFRMANIDKHMELIAMGTTGGFAGLADFKISGAFAAFRLDGPGDLQRGVVFSDLFPEGTIEPTHPEAKINFTAEITVGDVGVYEGKGLIPFLRSMLEETRRVYERFEALCVATGRADKAADAPIYWRFNAPSSLTG